MFCPRRWVILTQTAQLPGNSFFHELFSCWRLHSLQLLNCTVTANRQFFCVTWFSLPAQLLLRIGFLCKLEKIAGIKFD
jgi:hypothetical protein